MRTGWCERALPDDQKGTPMNKLFNLKAALVAAAMLVLPVAQAATMAKAEYDAGKTRISADYKTDKAACAGQAGNAKDICVEEAKAKEKVARAELEYAYTCLLYTSPSPR